MATTALTSSSSSSSALHHPCGKPGCKVEGTKRCSGCNVELYCSPACQKADWKIHKILCPLMKENEKLVEFREVHEIVTKLLAQAQTKIGTDNYLRLLKYALSYAEYQYGDRIPGKDYRQRCGCRMSNWNIDVLVYYMIIAKILNAYIEPTNRVDQVVVVDESSIIYYNKKAISILQHWESQSNLPVAEQIDILDGRKLNDFYICSASTMKALGQTYFRQCDYLKAVEPFDKAIVYARKVVTGKEGIELLYHALISKGQNCYNLFDAQGARVNYEEAYILISEAKGYDSTHHLCSEAANALINALIQLNEYYDAERFARIAYEALTRPVDPESLEVAEAADMLAKVLSKLYMKRIKDDGDTLNESDIKEAEMLSKKSLRIIEKNLHGSVSRFVLSPLATLADILKMKRKKIHDEEIENLLERSLAILRTVEGLDGMEVGRVSSELASFHHYVAINLPTPSAARKECLKKAQVHSQEAVRIIKKIFPPTERMSIEQTAFLVEVTRLLKLEK